jgi:multiple sugar transport system substrate-binding protein
MSSRSRTRIWLIALLMVVVAAGALAGGQEEKRTIALWTGYPECMPVFNAAAADFMVEHPNITVEVASFELRESEQKYAISLPAGTAPELFDTSHLFAHQFIAEGFLEPVPANVLSWMKDNFDAVAYDAFLRDGKHYAVPWIHGYQVLYYNLDQYKEAGLAKPPATLEELMSYARKLAKYDAANNLVRSGISLRLSGGGMGVAQKFDIFLFANGGSVMEPTAPGKWKANFANEAGYTAMKFFADAVHKYRVDGFEVKHDSEAFVSGITSQFNRETYVIGDAKKRAPGMNYGITQVVGGSERATNFNVEGLVIPQDNKNKGIAWEFAMYLNKDKYLVQMMRDVGWTNTRNGVDYSAVYALEPHFQQALDRPKGFKLIMAPPAASFNEVYTKFSSKLVEAFADKSFVDNRDKIMAFLKGAADEANAIMKSNNEYSE